MYVLYRIPNCWRVQDIIWHRGGPQGREGSWGGVDLVPYPPGMWCIKGVWRASGASAVHFGENFIKQKLLDIPDLVAAGHFFGPQIWIWKDLGPISFWSHDHSLWRGVHKIKVAVFVTKSYLVRLDTSYRGSGASAVHFGEHFITQKLLGTPKLVGVGYLFGPERTWTPCASGAVFFHFHKEFITQKL